MNKIKVYRTRIADTSVLVYVDDALQGKKIIKITTTSGRPLSNVHKITQDELLTILEQETPL